MKSLKFDTIFFNFEIKMTVIQAFHKNDHSMLKTRRLKA